MGATTRNHPYTVDLNKPLTRQSYGVLGEGDIDGDAFVFTLIRNGAALALASTVLITGYFVRADGDTVILTGEIADGKASVTLPQSCYVTEGRSALTVKATIDGATTTIAMLDGFVKRTTTDTVVDPGTVYPSLEAFLSSGESSGSGGSTSTDAVVPSYWQTHLDNRVVSIREAMAAAGWNRSAFLWYHDAHWSYNYKNSPALLKYLHQHTPINKTFFGGDIVDSEGETSSAMAYLWEWRAAIRDLPNHHSVAGNHDDGNEVNNRWDDAYIYNFLLAAEETPDVVRGDEGLYYYIDNTAEKTRYLFLDTATYDGNFQYNSKQQAWLKASLLSTPAGWHIVAVSHIWVKVNYTVWPPVVTGLDSSGKAALDIFDAYNARTGDYADCTGKVEFVIGGHSHVDADYKSDGGIPVILTECDGRGVRSGLDCTKGTTTEQSVNAVIADYTNGIVTIVRVGRGNSRIVNLDGSGSEVLPNEPETPETPDEPESDYDLIAPTGNYTNQIKIASDGSGNVYNTYGYKNDVRLSVSSLPASERDATGWDLTGYIPVKPGDVVRLKNILFYESVPTSTNARCAIVCFDSSFAFINQMTGMTIDNPLSGTMSSIVHDDDGQLVQFTMTDDWVSAGFSEGYMRICAHNITGASVITVNEEIVIDE